MKEVKKINGIKNEYELINYLNNKKFNQIHIVFRELIESLFYNVSENDIISAYKYGSYAKCDMVIEINGEKKGISIKIGSKNSVHLETVESFCDFLRINKFKYINKFKKYLYSDGTNNNTGKNRISSIEYKKNHKKDIIKINRELFNLKEKLIYRFLICSDINYKVKVDAFIYGGVNDFLWVTTKEVFDYFDKEENIESSGIHIMSLFIQCWNKNLIRNPKYEHCRNYIQVKWYSMFDDVMKIMLDRNNKDY